MLVLVQLMLLMMMMMKKSDCSSDIITVSSGDTVQLPLDRQVEERWDVRWTHLHLVLHMKKTSHEGRYELLRDGALRLNRVQPQDAGNYTVEVFDERGSLLAERHFQLQVEESSSSSSGGGSGGGGSVAACVVILLFLLLILSIIFILRRRRSQMMMPTGQTEDNIYMVMHGRHGNAGTQEEHDKKEEDAIYVPLHPATLIEHAEDVYV